VRIAVQHTGQGFYREDVVDEAGRTVRKRVAVNLGPQTEIPNEKAAAAAQAGD